MVSLPTGELHLYSADFSHFDAADIERSCSHWLGADEQRRYARYALPRHRRHFLLGRVLLRLTLSRYAQRDPADWELANSAWGKPRLARQPGEPMYFNLSHSGNCLLMVLGRQGTLGVDVERSDRPRRVRRIARRYFSPLEVDALLTLPAREQQAQFYRLWTLKESYIKARGAGLALGLRGFSFGFPEIGVISFSADPGLQEQPAAWQFWQFPHGSDYQAAVAVQEHDRQAMALRHWRLPALDTVEQADIEIMFQKTPG